MNQDSNMYLKYYWRSKVSLKKTNVPENYKANLIFVSNHLDKVVAGSTESVLLFLFDAQFDRMDLLFINSI
jgi:hypothetical protein